MHIKPVFILTVQHLQSSEQGELQQCIAIRARLLQKMP